MIRLPARSPQIASFVLFLGLCASGAYWTLHLMKPRPRAVAAAVTPAPPPVDLNAAGMLFGGAPVAASAAPSSYQLKGVVASAGERSAAIIVVEGQPALILGVGATLAPGVTVSEVHAHHVVLMENGAARRLDLPEPSGPSSTGTAPPGIMPAAPTIPTQPVMPPPQAATEPPQSRQPTPQPAFAPGQMPGSVTPYQPVNPGAIVTPQPPPQAR